nr:MAG TPA: hypothetical protein [Caudoviricetes sp.]
MIVYLIIPICRLLVVIYLLILLLNLLILGLLIIILLLIYLEVLRDAYFLLLQLI